MNAITTTVSNVPVRRWLSRVGRGVLFVFVFFLWIGVGSDTSDTGVRGDTGIKRPMRRTTVRGYLP